MNVLVEHDLMALVTEYTDRYTADSLVYRTVYGNHVWIKRLR
jgi:hypothetical protein